MSQLRARGVCLSRDRDILVIRPVSAVTGEEIAALRQHKAAILTLLQGHVAGTPDLAPRFRRRMETSSPPREGSAPMAAAESPTTAQLRARLGQQGVRAWRFPWPATLNGVARQIGPLTSCAECGAWTFVRYGEVAFCLPCVVRSAETPTAEVTPPDSVGADDAFDWEVQT
jgi:hypothetical protein